MNTSSMKNIVVLKDLPLNLIEEAIVFLKENQKLKKPELIDIEAKKINGNSEGKTKNIVESKDYIVNEAQMLIAEYISKLESKNKKEDISYQKLKNKYKVLKKLTVTLAIALVATTFLLFL